MKAFIESHFRYCPLVLMFHSRNLNNKLNRIHERALRIAYNDKSLSFQELLNKDKSVTIHYRNFRTLANETYNAQKWLSPLLLNEDFVERDCNYNLRRNNFPNRQRVNSLRYGTKSVAYLAPKRIREILRKEIKDSEGLNTFKGKIKIWVPRKCPCRLCKV